MVENSVSCVVKSPLTNQQQLATIWVPSKKARNTRVSENLEDIAKDLLTRLSTQFSASMVPSLLVPMDVIPMTRSYKIDLAMIRQEIEQMDTHRLALYSLNSDEESSDAPRDEVEQIIASALADVTGMDLKSIRRHTSFYKVGLDSLSAVSFSRKMQESGLTRLAVSTILQRSSIAQLATIENVMTNGQEVPADPSHESTLFFEEAFRSELEAEFKRENLIVKKLYPCTPLQEAMLAAKSDTESAYFNHLLLRVNTNVDELKSAWTQMLQRHDILRTCFRQTNDKRFAFAQIVLDSIALPWSYVEVSSQGLRHDVEKKKAEFESRSPFKGMLPYSLTLYADGTANTTHLLLSIHHALYDGEGIAQLLQEVQVSLSGQSLPETTPFHKFIDYILSANTEFSDRYWDRYLSGISPSLLPTPIQALQDESGSQQIQMNLKDSFSSFKGHCKSLSVTPLNVFHAAWARLLSFYADSSDVSFGNVFSCRTIPLEGADRIVGPCFNTLPMRVKFTSNSTNADTMKLSQKHNSDILPYQLTPLRHIQKRTLTGGSALFDTLVILQTRGAELDPKYWELLSDEGNMGFPLICEVIPDETEDRISISLHYQKSYLEHEVAERLAQDFVALVEHTTQYPLSQASDSRPIGGAVPQIFQKKFSNTSQTPVQTKISRPWSSQEELLREIVCQYSKVDSEAVSLHTTIFQLGLDSINAVQITGKLRQLGYKISAGDILEVGTSQYLFRNI